MLKCTLTESLGYLYGQYASSHRLK